MLKISILPHKGDFVPRDNLAMAYFPNKAYIHVSFTFCQEYFVRTLGSSNKWKIFPSSQNLHTSF